MNKQPSKLLGFASVVMFGLAVAACSSSGTPSTGVGGNNGGAGTTGNTGAGGGAVVHVIYPLHPGSCMDNHDNPDYPTGGACAPECQSVGCGTACSEDCCVTCGIDAKGIKYCNCRTPGLAYANCTCAPPMGFPTGLHGGPCMPQGDSRAMPPVGAAMAIRGMPCKAANLVCFTMDSQSSSERGCICQEDSPGVLTLHCGSVNKWFINDGVITPWMP